MRDDVEKNRRNNAGDDGKHDIAEAQNAGRDLHPFAQAAKDPARNARIFIFVELFHRSLLYTVHP